MPQQGKNKGNKNAALKPGELGRVQWTQTLSGDRLRRVIAALGIETSAMTGDDLKAFVTEQGRAIFDKAIDQLIEHVN